MDYDSSTFYTQILTHFSLLGKLQKMPFKGSRAILSELFSNKDPKLPKMLLVQ